MPSWKQSMVVLLMLFPIVMVELRFLLPRLRGLDEVLATFLGNALSVWVLAWPLMPLANRGLDWWLRPGLAGAWFITPLGIGLLLGLYLAEITVFLRFV